MGSIAESDRCSVVRTRNRTVAILFNQKTACRTMFGRATSRATVVHTCTHIHTHIYIVHTCTHTYTSYNIRTYIVHTCTHINTHIHTHACKQMLRHTCTHSQDIQQCICVTHTLYIRWMNEHTHIITRVSPQYLWFPYSCNDHSYTFRSRSFTGCGDAITDPRPSTVVIHIPALTPS